MFFFSLSTSNSPRLILTKCGACVPQQAQAEAYTPPPLPHAPPAVPLAFASWQLLPVWRAHCAYAALSANSWQTWLRYVCVCVSCVSVCHLSINRCARVYRLAPSRALQQATTTWLFSRIRTWPFLCRCCCCCWPLTFQSGFFSKFFFFICLKALSNEAICGLDLLIRWHSCADLECVRHCVCCAVLLGRLEMQRSHQLSRAELND